MSDTTHRDSVKAKSFRSSKELVAYCKSIDQGWFRCQAIAIGAAKLDRKQCETACRAAVKAAQTERDIFRRVTPLAWPVATLAAAGFVHQAEKLANDALKQAKSVVPSNSKAETLDVFYQHFGLLNIELRKQIFSELVGMASAEQGWRIGRNCACIAKDLDRLGERVFIERLIDGCKNTKLVNRIHRDRKS